MFPLLQSIECCSQHVLVQISSTSVISLQRQTKFDGCKQNTGKNMTPCMLTFSSWKTNANTKYSYIQNWMVACISSVTPDHFIRHCRSRVVKLLHFRRTRTHNYCVSVSSWNILAVLQKIILRFVCLRPERSLSEELPRPLTIWRHGRIHYIVTY
jgi:hypothetical protein